MTAGRPGLSVAIITLNEERNIAACLHSVKWANEIVVCDSGSRDRTVEIAASYGAQTFRDEWRGFAGHKNLAVERCRREWVLVLDADERVSEALRQEIEGVLGSAEPADGYSIGRRNYFVGEWVRHGGWYPDRSVRLFRNGRGRFQPRAVHEAVEVAGTVGALRESLEHHTYSSVREFLQRMARYADLAAEEMRAAGKRSGVIDLTLRPVWTVLRMYVLQRGFLDGWRGLVLAGLYGAYTFVKYATLWEREHRSPDDAPSAKRLPHDGYAGPRDPAALVRGARGSEAAESPGGCAGSDFASVPGRFLRDSSESLEAAGDRIRRRMENPYFRSGHILLPRPVSSGARLLDIGGGSGRWASYARELGWDVTIVDAAPERLRSAAGLGFRTVRHDLNLPLPFEPASFRGAIMTEVLEHIPKAEELLAETSRVLASDGFVVLTTPNNAQYKRRIRALQGRSLDDEGVHFRFFVKRKLMGMVEAAGFIVSATHSYGTVPLVDRVLLRRARGKGRGRVVVAPWLEAVLADRFVWRLEKLGRNEPQASALPKPDRAAAAS